MAVKYLLSFMALLTLAIPARALLPGVPYFMASFNVNADPEAPGPTGNCWTALDNSDGAAVVLEPCLGVGSPAQSWSFQAGAPVDIGTGGVGTIKIFGDKCLDVTDGVDASGTKLQIYGCATGNTNQMWQLTTDDSEAESVKWVGSTRCVDLTSGSQTAGTPLQIWTCQADNDNQKWYSIYASPTPPSGGATFRLSSAAPGGGDRPLVVLAENDANNEPVVLEFEDIDNIDGEDWTYNGSQLSNYEGSLCLDVTDGVNADGTKLQVFACTAGNTNQEFVFNSNFTIQWKNTNKCVDLTGGVVASGTPLQILTCSPGDKNQQWKISPDTE